MNGLRPHEIWSLFWPSIVAATVAAGLCGALGFFVVVRRVAFVSAALGQVAGLGVAFGFLLGGAFGHDPHGPTPLYLDPVLLALVFCGAVSAALALSSRVKRTSPESLVAFVYLAAAALALVVLSTPFMALEKHELEDLLFGKAVAVQREHLVELALVALVVAALLAVLFKDLLFVSFDREMAQTLSLPVTALELTLNISVGVTVAVATRAIGALPVFGFLVLPTGAALMLSDSVRGVVWLSISGAVLAALVGFYVSLLGDWVPAGPMMVAVCALYWPLAAGVRALRPRAAR
jgi:zinc transport system permease protein